MKTCNCGHTDEEHRSDQLHRLHECGIEDCDCICFDWDGEEDPADVDN